MRVQINDPGHGGTDPGATGNGILEKDKNLDVCLELTAMLKSRGVDGILTRGSDVTMSLTARTDLAVKLGVDAVISVHHNAGGGKGIETYRSLFNAKSGQLANLVHGELVRAFPEMLDRKVKTRLYTGRNDWDYYHMIRVPHVRAGIPAIITECGFVDSAADAAVIKRADFAHRQAEALAKGICAYFGVPWDLSWHTIIHDPRATAAQAHAWASKQGATPKQLSVIPIYWKYGELTGIDPAFMFAQSCHETGYGKFGRAVTEEMNNFAGIKIGKSSAGEDTGSHETFATIDDGVRAHFNHISAYCGLKPIGTPHARYNMVVTASWAGKIKHVEQLGGNPPHWPGWAPNPNYGHGIVALLNALLATQAPDEPGPETLTEYVDRLEQRIERLEKAVFG